MEEIHREYGRLARRYDRRWAAYTSRSIQETLDRLDLVGGESILDLGCGTGKLLEALHQQYPRCTLTGTEPVAAMRSRARDRLPDAVTIAPYPAEELEFPQHAFDVVVSTSVWHFIQETPAALARIRYSLHPQGRLIITDWCGDFHSMRLLDTWLHLTNKAHRPTLTRSQLQSQLSAAGFHLQRMDSYKISPLWGLMTAVARPSKS